MVEYPHFRYNKQKIIDHYKTLPRDEWITYLLYINKLIKQKDGRESSLFKFIEAEIEYLEKTKPSYPVKEDDFKSKSYSGRRYSGNLHEYVASQKEENGVTFKHTAQILEKQGKITSAENYLRSFRNYYNRKPKKVKGL